MKRIIAIITVITLLVIMSANVFAADPVYKPREVTVTVNGNVHKLLGYEVPGGDPNGVKIRDIAILLNGTSKQFNVTFENDIVNIIPGEAYTPMGTELRKFDGSGADGVYSTHTFMLNGSYCGTEATLAEDYNYISLGSFLYLIGDIYMMYNEDGSVEIDTEAAPMMDVG